MYYWANFAMKLRKDFGKWTNEVNKNLGEENMLGKFSEFWNFLDKILLKISPCKKAWNFKFSISISQIHGRSLNSGLGNTWVPRGFQAALQDGGATEPRWQPFNEREVWNINLYNILRSRSTNELRIQII